MNASDSPRSGQKSRKRELPKINVAGLCFLMAALLIVVWFLNSRLPGADAQQPNSNSRTGVCESRPEGAPCPLGGGVNSSCNVGRCRNEVCTAEPKPAGTSCPDGDGNPCTVARCSASGRCEQRSQLRPDGTACTDSTPGCRDGEQTCTGGQCLPAPGVRDPSQVARVSLLDVQVSAADRNIQRAADNDCCPSGFDLDDCDRQVLEAIVPTANGPHRLVPGDPPPVRQKFCGTISNYDINDENEDPHDIDIDIRPANVTPYPNFVAGLVNTPATEDQAVTDCRVRACLDKAKTLQDLAGFGGKVIHAEVTPDQSFYGADGRFLPIENSFTACGVSFPFGSPNKKCTDCIDGEDCLSELEPHDGRPGAEACVYGVYAYDHGKHPAEDHEFLCCSPDKDHDHPEIHPFDAIWWRHPEQNGWIFGVFQDDSNRYSFPHCRESQSNGNTWSQAPRDLTFHFPFRFPRRSSNQLACLRHVRTRRLRDDVANTVGPMNITTGIFANFGTEIPELVIGVRRYLQVMKEPKSERETHIRVMGSIIGNDVVGEIILRVIVGCDERTGSRCDTSFDRLDGLNPLVNYDKSDPGAGYFYAELTFGCGCS